MHTFWYFAYCARFVLQYQEDLPRVVQSFPILFSVPLPRMRGVLELFQSELLISSSDITKIVRAFPSLLGLEPEVSTIVV